MTCSATKLAIAFSTLFASASASAATVAVMPVEGVNLTQGEEDAIGVLFARAFARDASVAVAAPAETWPVLNASKSMPAAAAKLGVIEYVELGAVRLSSKITVTGVLRRADGGEVFRADMTAASLDDMEQVMTRLARALIWRQPVLGTMTLDTVTVTEGKRPNRTFSERVVGLKTGLTYAVAAGKSLSPMMSLQFDTRLEGRVYFVEFGAGVTIPADSATNRTQMGGVFAEFGGSYYLNNDSTSLYVGGGVSPRLFLSGDDGGARCAFYGQAGVMFMRESSTRLYAEIRVSQNVLPYSEREYDAYSGLSSSSSDRNYYPTEFALQLGVGW